MTPSWQLVRPGFELLKRNNEVVLIIVLLPTLLLLFGSLLFANHFTAGLIVLLIGTIWRLVNAPVNSYLQVAVTDGKKPTIGECYRAGIPYWVRIVGFEILFSIMTIIGLILLIAPGLIVIRRYYMTPFYIIKGNLPISEAMRKSEHQTKPVAGYVWGVLGVLFAFTILASIFSKVPYIGPILAALISLIYLFGPALRWQEIRRAGKK